MMTSKQRERDGSTTSAALSPPAALTTWGSSRQSHAFARARSWSAALPHAHVDLSDGERCDLDSLRTRLGPLRQPVVAIAFPRATRHGESARIADAWDRLTGEGLLSEGLLVGPRPRAARTFEDKWLTYLALREAGLPAAPLEPAGAAQRWDRFPAIVKPTGLTGGAGIEVVTSRSVLQRQVARLEAAGLDAVVGPVLHGVELSLKALVVGGRLHPVAAVLKGLTGARLLHADWKVKLALPLGTVPEAPGLLAAFCKRFETAGFVSLEGILQFEGDFRITEVALRQTGSFAISQHASGPAGCFEQLDRFAAGAGPLEQPADASGRSGVQLPVSGRHWTPEVAEALQAHPYLLEIREDRLDKLALSPSAGTRYRVSLRSDTDGAEECALVDRRLGTTFAEERDRLLRVVAERGLALR